MHVSRLHMRHVRQCDFGFGDKVKNAPRVVVQQTPAFSRRNSTPAAIEQTHAQRILDVANVLAHPGLAHHQPLCGRAETAFLHYALEYL